MALKKDNVKRLRFLLDIINEVKTEEEPNNPYNLDYIALTIDIYKKTFDLGLDPYLIEKDLKMLVKMGKISESEGIDGYYVSPEEWEDKDPSKRDIYATIIMTKCFSPVLSNSAHNSEGIKDKSPNNRSKKSYH